MLFFIISDINKIINLDKGGVLNFETCIESSEIDCQSDIFVFSFNGKDLYIHLFTKISHLLNLVNVIMKFSVF